MFHMESGAPFIAHIFSLLLVIALISIACIGAFAKKARLLSLGLFMVSVASILWFYWSCFNYPADTEFWEFMYMWFVPLLNLLEAAGWGCVLVGVFKLPKPE